MDQSLPQLPTGGSGVLVPEASARTHGTVAWYCPDRGFGFVTPDDAREDVFVAWSVLPGDGFRSLDAGQRVSFRRSHDQHGPIAVAVTVLDA